MRAASRCWTPENWIPRIRRKRHRVKGFLGDWTHEVQDGMSREEIDALVAEELLEVALQGVSSGS
jgi:hypothetical protein